MKSNENKHTYRLIIALVIVFFSFHALVSLSEQSLDFPLLDRHCMKSIKSMEISYNMVQYHSPFTVHVDWDATPTNPKGSRGSIIKYESPLSAIILSWVYRIIDSEYFASRLETGRYYALLHVVFAYLLISLVFLRKNFLALISFSFLFVYSQFMVSYSMKPIAETFAVFYQALFLVGGAALLNSRFNPYAKAIAMLLLSVLFCTGGKMNYFLIAGPAVIFFPLLDSNIVGLRQKAKYYLLLTTLGTTIAGILYFVGGLNFERIFGFMIKGNQEILNDSLWITFKAGFDSFEEVRDRTREHFGSIPYYFGSAGALYLIVKKAVLSLFPGRYRPSAIDAFQTLLACIVLGHMVNYFILKNLYLPHYYYVVPLYMVLCLSAAMLFADLGQFAVHFTRNWTKFAKNTARGRSLSLLTLGACLCVIALALMHFRRLFSIDEDMRSYFIYTAKYLGSTELAITLGQTTDHVRESIDWLAHTTGYLGIITAVLGLGTLVLFLGQSRILHLLSKLDNVLAEARITPATVAVAMLLASSTTYAFVQNSRMFFDYTFDDNLERLIKSEEKLAQIREDTIDGELILCEKWCFAFYAAKRSITKPTRQDLKYYMENNIHYLFEPRRDLANFYKKVSQYPPPETYWEPRSSRNAQASQKRRTIKN
jgi:hypothetical protein